jgi:DNA-binding NtrC family response regulator
MQRNRLKKTLTSLVAELVENGITLEQASREFERQFLIASIRVNEGNLSRSALSLGVHRNTLRNKLGRLGITAKDYAGKPPKAATSR